MAKTKVKAKVVGGDRLNATPVVRNVHGQFVKGHSAGRGRPRKVRVADMKELKEAMQKYGITRALDIWKKTCDLAAHGHMMAIQEFNERMYGKVKNVTELDLKQQLTAEAAAIALAVVPLIGTVIAIKIPELEAPEDGGNGHAAIGERQEGQSNEG